MAWCICRRDSHIAVLEGSAASLEELVYEGRSLESWMVAQSQPTLIRALDGGADAIIGAYPRLMLLVKVNPRMRAWH